MTLELKKPSEEPRVGRLGDLTIESGLIAATVMRGARNTTDRVDSHVLQ